MSHSNAFAGARDHIAIWVVPEVYGLWVLQIVYLLEQIPISWLLRQ